MWGCKRRWPKVRSLAVAGVFASGAVILAALGAGYRSGLPTSVFNQARGERRLVGPESGPDDELLASLRHGPYNLRLQLDGGSCSLTRGAFNVPPLSPFEQIGLWSEDVGHILCYMPRHVKQIKLMAVLLTDAGEPVTENVGGQFGFGEDVSVDIQPDLAEPVAWPIQEGLSTLPMEMPPGQWYRVLSLGITQAGSSRLVPVVVWTPQQDDWPVDVRLLDSSQGSCSRVPWGHPQFQCSIDNTAADKKVQIVALGQPGGVGSPDPDHEWLLTMDSEEAPAVSHWIGWSSARPGSGRAEPRFKIYAAKVSVDKTNSRAPPLRPGVSMAVETQEFDIVLFDGSEGRLNLLVGSPLRIVGYILCCVAVVGFLLMVISIVVDIAVGQPNKLRALLPVASSTLPALQLLAYLGSDTFAVLPLQALCGPFVVFGMSSQPGRTLRACLVLLMAALVFHAGAVLGHIMRNGSGSAEALPHGMKFGSWELRFLLLLALPLAASSTELLMLGILSPVDVIDPLSSHAMLAIPAAACLVALVATVHITWQRVTKAVSEAEVVQWSLASTVMPDSFQDSVAGSAPVIFMDRACDQLLAIPATVRAGRLQQLLATGPAWLDSPPVATVRPIEHRGLVRSHSAASSSSGIGGWGQSDRPAAGEWMAQQKSSEEITDDTMHTGRRSRSLQCRSVSDDFRTARTKTYSWSFFNFNESQVHELHPVAVRTKFVYKGSELQSTLAGVASLPWLDVALPSSTLSVLSHKLGTVAFRVCAGQLSGPITSGRLVACFDWGTRWPWRYPLDIALKIVIGIWLALSPHSQKDEHPAVLHGTASLALSVGAVLLASSVAVAMFVLRPYHRRLDNAAMVASIISAALAVTTYSIVDVRWAWIAVVALAIVVSILVVGVFLTGSVACQMCFASRSTEPADVIRAWAEDLALTKSEAASRGYADDDHIVIVKLQDMPESLALPGKVRPSIRYLRMKGGSKFGSVQEERGTIGAGWISVPSYFIFPVASHFTSQGSATVAGERTRGEHVKVAPIIALTEPPNDGLLLYSEDELNPRGVSWDEAIQQHLGSRSEACVEKVCKFVRDHGMSDSESGSLAIIEIEPSTSR